MGSLEELTRCAGSREKALSSPQSTSSSTRLTQVADSQRGCGMVTSTLHRQTASLSPRCCLAFSLLDQTPPGIKMTIHLRPLSNT